MPWNTLAPAAGDKVWVLGCPLAGTGSSRVNSASVAFVEVLVILLVMLVLRKIWMLAVMVVAPVVPLQFSR